MRDIPADQVAGAIRRTLAAVPARPAI